MDELSVRRLRLLVLQGAVAVADLLAAALRRFSRHPRPAKPAARKGVSIIIPERGNAALLGDCLNGVESALRGLADPAETLVVVNGSAPDDYSALALRHRAVRWIFCARPLGFSAAVRKGVVEAQFDWVFLLNNDVVLEQDALQEVLRWRAPGIFAVASQIFLEPETSPRVETGWTDYRLNDGVFEIVDVPPEDSPVVRGALYAGGGASLFQKRLLKKYIGSRDPYYPFYWEDVEWGTRARKDGYFVLFCPSSKARHRRRATVCRFFPEAEVERIFRRNGFLFQLRNLRTLGSLERLWARLIDLDSVSFSELTSCRKIVSVFLARIRAAWEPFSDHSLEYATHSYHHLPHSELHHRPTVLTVSPYALFPPSHGGAVRLDRLLGVVARECNIVLLSDEAEDHSPRSAPYLCRFAEIHLVGNRREPQGQDRISRIRAHSRSLLKERLAALDRALQPDLIQVEFSELAGLAAVRRDAPPWLITLHEVQFSADSPGAEDLYELGLLSHYDGIIACSPEDQSLIPFESTRLVANGVDACIPYSSSSGNRSILFAGPFRYRPNFEGILAFLESVYPELLKRLPAPELWILGGPEALHLAKSARAFRQRGVVLYDYYQDPRPFLEKAAVTINPLVGIRGSSIKLLESIAAGRVVVSTRDGARGFGTEPFPSLIVVEKVQDFLAPLERLLLDESYRLRLEPPDRELLAAHSWEAAGDCLLDVYRSYIEGGCHR